MEFEIFQFLPNFNKIKMQLSFQQTNRFALNSSTSKYQYLFPKANRFHKTNNKFKKAKFYTLPSMISYKKQKAPTFPKLIKKLEFDNEKQKKIIPSPSAYSFKSDIQKSLSEKRGISIPKETIRVKKQSQSPGPSDYTPKRQPFMTARYSIGNSKKKLQFPIQLQKGKQSPGPAYMVNVDKLQKIVSKFVQNKCLNIYSQSVPSKLSKSSRLNPQSRYLLNKQKISNKSLSPNKYLSLQKLPKYNDSISNLMNSNKKDSTLLLLNNSPSIMGKFNKAQRKTIFSIKNNTPGPGYNWFSQFSKLQKQVYNKKIKAQKKRKSNIRDSSQKQLINSIKPSI